MSQIQRILMWCMLAVLAVSCTSPATGTPSASVLPSAVPPVSSLAASTLPEPQIVRHPQPVDYSRFFEKLTSIPKYDPASDDPWQIDLRSRNLKKIDMTASLPDLMYATFDSQTRWPEADKMPAGFDWPKIMELGKDPGLGMRALHQQGVTGKGIGIAIIDQTLLVDHIEYKDRVRVYEEAEDVTDGWQEVQMHGPAVASIAVGRTAGVAPEADLYYIATGDCGGANSIEDMDFSCRAKSIRRIVEINTGLPADRKIRVLSMSIGWAP